MGDLYASAIGTTVLQLKEIPPRPKKFDGVICLFREGTDAEAARQQMRSASEAVLGYAQDSEIKGPDPPDGWPEPRVRTLEEVARELASGAADGVGEQEAEGNGDDVITTVPPSVPPSLPADETVTPTSEVPPSARCQRHRPRGLVVEQIGAQVR